MVIKQIDIPFNILNNKNVVTPIIYKNEEIDMVIDNNEDNQIEPTTELLEPITELLDENTELLDENTKLLDENTELIEQINELIEENTK